MYSLRLLFDNTELFSVPSSKICTVPRFRTGDVVVCRLKNLAHPESGLHYLLKGLVLSCCGKRNENAGGGYAVTK